MERCAACGGDPALGSIRGVSDPRDRDPPGRAGQEQSRDAPGAGRRTAGIDERVKIVNVPRLTERWRESMREERGTIAGDLVVNEPLTLWGSVGGNVTVA